MHKCHWLVVAAATAIAPIYGQAQQVPPAQLATPNAAAPNPTPNAPKLPVKSGVGLPPDLFGEVLTNQIPLSPPQVREINRSADAVKRARAARPDIMPQPVSTSMPVSFAPGKASHVVRLAANMVTNLVFTDITGAVWLIDDVIIGDKTAFGIPDEIKKRNTNILPIFVLEEYGATNMTVILRGAPAPLVFTLVTGQHEVDYRLDVMAQGRGPNAKALVIADNVGEGAIVSSNLISILDGLPPSGSISLKSSHGEVQAWSIGQRTFVRTRMNLLSPRTLNTASSADGTRVYEIVQTPVIMVMSNGKVQNVSLSGMPSPNASAQASIAATTKP